MPFLRGILVAALLLGPAVPDLSAQDDLAARAQRVLADADCQTTLPGEAHGGRGAARDPRDRQGGRRRPSRAGEANPSRPASGGAELASVLLWLAVAVAVACLVVAILRSRRDGAAAVAAARIVRGRSTEVAPPTPPELPDHARLAAAGDFAGALQALLRHAFAAWTERAGAVPVHATAREVLRRARTALPTEPLAHLVGAVERVHFGGQPADRDQYDVAVPQLARWEDACRKPT